jgi:RNase P subunit RPR2
MNKFLKEYRVEIIALVVIALGVFLLVEPFEIRESLMAWAARLAEQAKVFSDKMVALIIRVPLSDWVGSILLLAATVFVAWRMRYRFMKSKTWRGTTCPKCGSSLVRVHRTRFERLLSRIVLPHGRRYKCSNSECNWSGLRHRVSHTHREVVVSDVEEDEAIGSDAS